MMSGEFSADVMWLIAILGLLTFATRFSGYVIISIFSTIPPRVEAALQAVPTAVIATLVVPPALTKGPAEAITMIVACIACYRLPAIVVLLLGLGLLAGLRLGGL